MDRIQFLARRAEVVAAIRRFFDERKYLSVETPLLAARPIPESHIELFATRYVSPAGDRTRDLFLLPSPEYYLKQLLAAGSGSIYEIARAFRNRDFSGGAHTPEFTMLEYYTVDADADDSLEITRDFLDALGVRGLPLVVTIEEAWRRWAGFPLHPYLDDADALGAKALETGAMSDAPEDESWEDVFHRILVTAIEPALPTDRPVFLTRYPASIPTLARSIPGTPWSDRWELYLGGFELANCYGEETDPERIRAFFTDQARRIEERDGTPPPVDETFADAALPRCSGVALGVDRLVAAILGESDIERVISFSVFR
jgi:lysyl-tRNA synthetase class 2